MKKLLSYGLKYFLILNCLVFSTAAAWAQANTVKGKITDDKSAPLAGVSVLLKGSKTGTSTDANGNFSINTPGAFQIVAVKRQPLKLLL